MHRALQSEKPKSFAAGGPRPRLNGEGRKALPSKGVEAGTGKERNLKTTASTTKEEEARLLQRMLFRQKTEGTRFSWGKKHLERTDKRPCGGGISPDCSKKKDSDKKGKSDSPFSKSPARESQMRVLGHAMEKRKLGSRTYSPREENITKKKKTLAGRRSTYCREAEGRRPVFAKRTFRRESLPRQGES